MSNIEGINMPETGFSKIKVIVLVVAVVLVGATSAVLVTIKGDEGADNAATASPGSTKAIDKLAADEANDESAIDGSYSSQDQNTVQDADKAADNVGGAYNDSDL
jgi:hypothetical protein